MTNRRGRYDLQYEIGRGAAGAVWAAWDTQLERRVALKLHAEGELGSYDPGRFELEARALANLKSPYVVRVYDVGVADGSTFLVMELLEGESLEAHLSRTVRLPISMAASLVSDICKGLAATHQAGLVHRDIKPANVFLAREAGNEVVKLLDFGIATRRPQPDAPDADEGLGRWLGTALYMSPEQLRGQPVDARSDLWALAVVSYRILTGRQPFEGSTMAKLADAVCTGSYPPVSQLVPALDARVDAFFQRALAKDPAQRFPSAEEFAREFALLPAGHPAPTRVLLLDDEPDMKLLFQQRFRRQLREGRYELHFATDGRAGLEELRTRRDIDVVLTDLNMPGMDGLTFLKQVPEVNPFVRVVVVSAYGDMTNIRTAMNRGAFDFLGKPIDFNDLQATIEKCAAHVAVVRQALQSAEENQLMRVLIGHGVADRWLTALRNGTLSDQTTTGTAAFIDVHGFARTLVAPFPPRAFERLNDYFALFARELLAKDGKVSRFVGDALLAIFEGEDHLRRAIDACLAIRARVRTLIAQDREGAHGVCIGIDSGQILMGPIGTLAMGHVEPCVLGETVSIAARLLALANKDELLVTAQVLSQLGTDYECLADHERTISTSDGTHTVGSVLRRTTAGSARVDSDRTEAISS